MNPPEAKFIMIGLGSIDKRYWAATRETVYDKAWFDPYQFSTEPKHFFPTVPSWFWSRMAEQQLTNSVTCDAEGWVELSKAEFEHYLKELQNE